MKDKVLVTAELGAFLTGNTDRLVEKFGMLTRVLDGEGLCTDTGAHGHRAVEDKIEFSWIGAATDLTPNKHAALSQIGGRILTLDVLLSEADEEMLVNDIIEGFPEQEKDEIVSTIKKFYEVLFATHPKSTLDAKNIKIEKPIATMIAALARVGALLRSHVEKIGEDLDGHAAYQTASEQPFRYARNLQLLASASAILRGSQQVEPIDLAATILPLVFSSGPSGRHRIFRELALSPNGLSAEELIFASGVGRTSTFEAIKELQALGLLAKGHFTGQYHVTPDYKTAIENVLLQSNEADLPSPLIFRTPYQGSVREIRGEGVTHVKGPSFLESLS